MNLKNIFVNLINKNREHFQVSTTSKTSNVTTTSMPISSNNKHYLQFNIPNNVNKEFLEIILDDIRNRIDGVNVNDLELLFKDGAVNLKIMDEYLDKLFTKTSCRREEDTCNISYKPYNEFDFNTINPNTKTKYTSSEIKNIKLKFKTKCNLDNGTELKKCCDPFDKNLKGSIPKYLLNRFKKV